MVKGIMNLWLTLRKMEDQKDYSGEDKERQKEGDLNSKENEVLNDVQSAAPKKDADIGYGNNMYENSVNKDQIISDTTFKESTPLS
ncbi:hypothetical protein Tco_1217058 [Tanacetum coccineum]